MKKDDIRVGLEKPSILRLKKWLQWHRYKKQHLKLHKNDLFYSVTPLLLEGILKAFDIQSKRNMLNGGYYEFGIFKGFSLWYACTLSKFFEANELSIYGFDSFEGLPNSPVDNSKPAFGEGHYCSSLEFVENKLKELNVIDMVSIFEGFYSADHFNKIDSDFQDVSICVIDCDVYESCVEVLNFIKPHLRNGSILLFDDYNCFLEDDNHGERRALSEFENENEWFDKKHIFDFGWHGAAFEVILKGD